MAVENVHNLGLAFLVQSRELQKQKGLESKPVGYVGATPDESLTSDFTLASKTFDIGTFAVVPRYGCNQYLNNIAPLSSLYTVIPKSFIYEIQQIVPEFTIEKYCEILSENKFVCRKVNLASICEFVHPTNPDLVKEYILDRFATDNVWKDTESQFYTTTTNFGMLSDIYQNKIFFSENNPYTININSLKNLDNYEFIEIKLPQSFPIDKYYYYTFCLLRHLYYFNFLYSKTVLTRIFADSKQDLVKLIHSVFSRAYGELIQAKGLNESSLFYTSYKPYISPYLSFLIENNKKNSWFWSSTSFECFNEKGYVLYNFFIANVFNKRNITSLAYKINDQIYYLYTYKELQSNGFISNNSEIVDLDVDLVQKITTNHGNNTCLINIDDFKSKLHIERIYIPQNTVKVMKKKAVLIPRVLSRQPSHNALRKALKANKYTEQALIRLGSTTSLTNPEAYTININSIQAIKNSSDKKLSKELFTANNIPTADWWTISNNQFLNKKTNQLTSIESFKREEGNLLNFKLVAKLRWSSQNRNNFLLATYEELTNFLVAHKDDLHKYIFEKYYNYAKEYRVHVCGREAFLIWRKALKQGVSSWFKNSSNCVWFKEDNPLFYTPVDKSYNEMLADCIRAIKAVGLDIGAVDILIQNNIDEKGKERTDCKYIVLETNSAPGMSSTDTGLSQTATAYLEEINKFIASKIN